MKKCPQCNTVYENETVYCLNDGTPLVEDTFSMPSEDYIEEETVIRREPIIVDFGAKEETPREPIYQVPPAENVIFVPAKPANSRNYVLFLLVGLLLGGGLVLATLLLSKTFNQNENVNSVKMNQTEKSVKTVSATENKNATVVQTISDKHEKTTSASDEEFNGRVIALKARVRSSPSAEAPVVDALPINDRLNIIERENPNSPWYRVECEHGTTGWMHGNTIKFTR